MRPKGRRVSEPNELPPVRPVGRQPARLLCRRVRHLEDGARHAREAIL